MYGNIKEHLQKEIQDIKDNGLFKTERIITSPQGAEITINTGETVLNFYPQTNSVTIVDYKTGTPSYDHEDQINGYASALAEMGYNVKDKILVYTNQTILINKI